MKEKWLETLRVLVGMLFAVSGFVKLLEPTPNFLAVIHRYQVLSGLTAQWVANTFPWAEWILGVFLITGLWRRFSVAGLWILNTVFLTAIGQAWIRGLPFKDCGCFGDRLILFSLPEAFAADLLLWMAFALLYFY